MRRTAKRNTMAITAVAPQHRERVCMARARTQRATARVVALVAYAFVPVAVARTLAVRGARSACVSPVSAALVFFPSWSANARMRARALHEDVRNAVRVARLAAVAVPVS